MTQPPRDWDKELAAVDRAMAKMPAGPAPTPAPAGRGIASPTAAPRITVASTVGRRERLATWVRVLFTVALAVGLIFWPYGRGCGLGLWLYMGAVAVTGLSALWAAVSAWHRRQGFMQLVALLALGWSLALAAREVLPRIGYAHDVAVWRCS